MAGRPYGAPTDFNLLKLALQEKDANETMPGRIPSGIAENAYFNSIPNTAEQQRESDSYANLADEGNKRRAAQNEALTHGYGSPAQADEAAFQDKMKLAGEPARVAGDASVRAAGSRSEAQLAAIQALLSGGGGDRSVSVSGVGSVGAPSHQPVQRGPAASVLNSVRSAKDAMSAAEPNGLMKMFGRPNPKKASYDQAVANALQSFHPQARQAASELVGRYGKMSPHELIQAAQQEGLTPGSPEEDELYNVLSIITGQF